MTSFLPRLEETIVDLLQYGDTGALRVSLDDRRWSFFVQGGVLIGIERQPPLEELPFDATAVATDLLAEAMQAKGALWDFEDGVGPDDFGLFDVRRAMSDALGRAREAHELLQLLQPVLEGWPELNVDADTLSSSEEVQAWLETLDGLAPGNARLIHAPPDPGPCLGALWVAWKLGDLDLHAGAVDDEDPSDLVDDDGQHVEVVEDPGSWEPTAARLAREDTEELDDPHGDDLDRTLISVSVDEALGLSLARPSEPPSVRKDPFILGVSKARAGEVTEALPLLEQAWEDDPDRPGLEEWLGYTRFAACRESDPEVAKAGLTALRDVMYRTGPTGETPILPWILMARAQYERGDFLQARSLLGSVLQREPDDPEAMHLDGLLRKAEAELETRRKRPEGVSLRRIVRMTSGVAMLAALVVSVQVVENTPEMRTNYAPEVAEVVPMRELHRVPRGWIGVTAEGWEGVADPDAIEDACEGAAQAVHMDDSETMLLLSDAGTILTECGPRVTRR